MNAIAGIALLLAFVSTAALAQPARDARDPSERRASVHEKLRRQPITFELDIPYAGTDDPRQRLDLYLPKAPNRDALPVIDFSTVAAGGRATNPGGRAG